ncbi:MAG: amino acid adenylation domain-containing protein [Defluviitaleaceae bacterium]|nr:amino acid adenylation domain-containing protein [Defluviitaleaceae bacterium]
MKSYPLTKPQKSIWNMEKFFGGSIANITGSAILNESVSINALRAALNKTLSQHESLRIRIKLENGIPMQYVSAFITNDFEHKKFINEEAFITWVENLATTPFNLEGDLYKFFVASVGSQTRVVIHLHHITADAWTLNILVNSILNNLNNENVSESNYLDYIAVEQEYEKSSRREKDKKYFIANFEKCNEPVYISDNQAESTASRRLNFCIDADSTTRIQDFCDAQNISPYSLFLNALAIYIYRVKGARNFFIGTSVLNRTGKKDKNTAGMFINTVPVLFNIDEDLNAIENLQENTNSIMGVFRHQKYQYGDLLKDIREQYGFSGKLYDVMLNYQNTAISLASQWHFCGCQGESLSIHINDRLKEGVFRLDYDYQLEIFSGKEIERLHGNLLHLIFEIIESPNKKPHELKLLSNDEFQQVIFNFNSTEADFPREKCVHQLFEEQVENTPEGIAVVFDGSSYTYRQINEMANSLAQTLRDKGIKRNDIVAIFAERSYKIIVAKLAILKAGGAYMPIDPSFPKERNLFMLGDAKCKIVLTLGVDASDFDMDTISLDGDLAKQTENLRNVNTSNDLCYCIFTSGSTGRPKGTLLHHKGIINLVYWEKNSSGMILPDKVALTTTVTFDVFTQEVMTALLLGKTAFLSVGTAKTNINVFVDFIRDNKIELLFSTPSFFDIVTFEESNAKQILSTVKEIALAGEEFYLNKTVSELKSDYNTVFHNQYGPAETHVISIATVQSADKNIGKPISNTQIYILDKHENPLPIGAIGELCISGEGVGCGYLNRPRLTLEKFVQNPFVKNLRMYKTGDLAKWTEDGNIIYLGRMDNLVKIRGLRIELGEIESAISRWEGIKQIAVTVKNDERGRQYICAYYIGAEVNVKAIKIELAKTLPQHMIPHFFTRLDVFPTTSSGKTDRNAFPMPDLFNIKSDTEYVPAVTDEEKEIIALMQMVLNVQKIGMNDSFFDLGGDSLKAIEFVSKAHFKGVYFALQDIFTNPTAAMLLKSIAGTNAESIEYSTADFKAVHELLQGNSIDENVKIQKQSTRDILITGSTGWLGAHVLDEFLSAEQGMAYCIVRGSDINESRARLNATLENYFGKKHMNSNRITVLCGDIEGRINLQNSINTIIHCAANVKHYGSYQDSHDANVSGTNSIIALAKEKAAKLVHISTTSVSGGDFNDAAGSLNTVFDETRLYIGQSLDNIYVRSKFESEAAVLRAKIEGLDAMVVRVGNLSNRRADYKFQQNHDTNATLARLKSFIDLGMYPEIMQDFPIEFSPVDDTAKAVITLAQHYISSYSMFHVYNHNMVRFSEFAAVLSAEGLKMDSVPLEEFVQAVRDAGSIPEKAHIYELFIHVMGEDGVLLPEKDINSNFTKWYLNRIGFDWLSISGEYLKGYIKYFKNIKYWSEEK